MGGAAYELDWGDDTDSADSDEDGGTHSTIKHQHYKTITAPVSHVGAANSLSMSQSSSPRMSNHAYKVSIKPKPMTHRLSASGTSETDKADTNANIEEKQSGNGNQSNNRYQATINMMQSKLNKERKLNLELQGQIEDLRAENQRLRKSKVDLMTWSNTEVAKYKKEIDAIKLRGGPITEGQ